MTTSIAIMLIAVAAMSLPTGPFPDTDAEHSSEPEEPTTPTADGVLLPPTELNHTALWLNVTNLSNDTAQYVIQIKENLTTEGPWFVVHYLFNESGFQKEAAGIGRLPLGREMVTVKAAGETIGLGPNNQEWYDLARQYGLAPEPRNTGIINWTLEMPPGKHHMLVMVSHTNGTLSIRADEGFEEAIVPTGYYIDSHLLRFQLSQVEGDWDHVETEVMVSDGQVLLQASTRVHLKYTRNLVSVITPLIAAYEEIRLEDGAGDSCTWRANRVVSGPAILYYPVDYVDVEIQIYGGLPLDFDVLLWTVDLPFPPSWQPKMLWCNGLQTSTEGGGLDPLGRFAGA